MNLERGLLLFEQGRHNLAEREFRRYLAAEPEDGCAHAVLSLALLEQEKLEEATHEAQEAIRCGPWMDIAHRAMAQVMLRRNRLPEALAAAEQAVGIDWDDADNFALLGSVHLERRDWPAALKAAEEALEVDAEHVGAQNLRAMALVNLGRREEAGLTIGEALHRQPDNPLTHANKGWALLHEGKPREAMEHFREALRLDPNLEWARQGMVEALKAKNIVYRGLLLYFLWMSRLSRRAQWGVIVGGFVGYQVLYGIVRNHPEAGVWVWPVIGAYIAFALMTWLGVPLFNLMLRLNRYGRMLLSRQDVVLSNWIGGLLLAAVALVVASFFGMEIGFELGLICVLMVIPVKGIFRADAGWPKKAMIAFTLALAGLGVAGFTVGGAFMVLFVLGVILSSWVSNAMMMATPRR
jgi:tetratricopeptide (TPR) repeat protein